MSILKNYRTCVLPKGIKLFRKALTTDFYETMFFAFSPFETFNALHSTEFIQLWKTTNDIEVLYMVKNVENNKKFKKSAIVEIYNYYFPEDEKKSNEYLILKKEDTFERRKLICKLRENNIFGWVTSVDNRISLEFFTFDLNKENNLSFVESFSNKNEYIYTIDTSNLLFIKHN